MHFMRHSAGTVVENIISNLIFNTYVEITELVSESWNCEFSGKVVVLHEGNILALQKDPPLNPDTLEDSTKNARKMGLASRDATLNNSSYKGNRIIPV